LGDLDKDLGDKTYRTLDDDFVLGLGDLPDDTDLQLKDDFELGLPGLVGLSITDSGLQDLTTDLKLEYASIIPPGDLGGKSYTDPSTGSPPLKQGDESGDIRKGISMGENDLREDDLVDNPLHKSSLPSQSITTLRIPSSLDTPSGLPAT
jgi:hypothetical protein